MGKRKSRYDNIFQTDRERVEAAGLELRRALHAAQLNLKTTSPHYRALGDLADQLRRTLNVIAGRPENYVDMGGPGFMSQLPPNATKVESSPWPADDER